jgi:hypothetical protein
VQNNVPVSLVSEVYSIIFLSASVSEVQFNFPVSFGEWHIVPVNLMSVEYCPYKFSEYRVAISFGGCIICYDEYCFDCEVQCGILFLW